MESQTSRTSDRFPRAEPLTGPTNEVPSEARGLRLGANLGALLLGIIAAVLLFPAATSLFTWSQTHVIGVGPFLVGMGTALLVTLFTRPWRWGRLAKEA